MSIVEDQMRAENAARREDNRMAEMDHRIEQAKIRIAQAVPKDPRVEEFKARRVWNTMQVRKWIPCPQVLSLKKRQF